jgi:hypothetical protein
MPRTCDSANDAHAPAPPAQVVGVVERVSRFVSQDLQAPFRGAAFDFEHLRLFQAHQPRMREVERNRDARHAVGREPFARQPVVRFEGQAARVKFFAQRGEPRLEPAAFDREAEIGESQIEQLLIGEVGPIRPGGRRGGRRLGFGGGTHAADPC